MTRYEDMARSDLLAEIRALEAKAAALESLPPSMAGKRELAILEYERELDFEKSPEPIFIVDRETTRFLKVNAAAVRLYGYTREEFAGMTLADLRPAVDIPDMQRLEKMPPGYMHFRGIRRHRKKSDEMIDVEVFAQEVQFQDTKARISVVIDTSARDRAMANLKRSQREFETLAEKAPIIITRIDRSFRHVYANRAFADAMRVAEDSESPLPPNLRSSWQDATRRVFETSMQQEIEFDVVTGEGTRHYEARLAPEPAADGSVATVLVIAWDVTERNRAQIRLAADIRERKRVEEELRAQKQLLDTIIDNLPVGVSLKDARTLRYIFRNRFVDAMMGYEPGEMIGKTPREGFAPEQVRESEAMDRKALAKRGMVESERQLIPRSGETRLALVRRVPLYGEDGEPQLLISICDDITDRKRSEARRLEREVELRKTLIREVHHRLKNNLQGIAGLLRQKVQTHAALASVLESAISEMQSIAMVFGLRSDMPNGDLRLKDMLKAIIASVGGATGGRVILEDGIDETTHIDIIDDEQVPVALVLNELIFNALKHGSGTEKTARISGREFDGGYDITVTNRGSLPTDFSFARACGTGSGLALVRSLLHPRMTALRYSERDGRVMAVLSLLSPLVVSRDTAARQRLS